MNAALPWRPASRSPGQGRGAALSLAVHVLLLVALKFGVDWRSSTEAPAFEAELWASVPQAAAPRAEEPPPPPPALPERPKPATRDTQAEDIAQRDAEIRLERQRQKDERLARDQAEKLEKEKAKAKADRDKLERDKRERERERDKAAIKRTERAERQERDKARLEREQADSKREQLRQEQLRRMLGQAGASGGPQSTGTAQQSSGPSASYAGRIKGRVKPNITLLDAISGNPLAEVEVRCAPDGLILSSKLVTKSGDPSWDAAVLRAVEKTERLPRDENGKVPPVIVLSFRPND